MIARKNLCCFALLLSFLLSLSKLGSKNLVLFNPNLQRDGRDGNLRSLRRNGVAVKEKSRFQESWDACRRDEADQLHMYKPCELLFDTRIKKWKSYDYDPVLELARDKLGAYYIASKLGVRSPLIKFCGNKEEFPQDLKASFGNFYVIKPINGYSARGVQVVMNGLDLFKRRNVTYESLQTKYHPEDDLLVEEYIESADPKFQGKIPPDYKFHVSRGVKEYADAIDRNSHCSQYLTFNSSNKWEQNDYLHGARYLTPERSNVSGLQDVYNLCAKDHFKLDPIRQEEMVSAVDKLASFTTNYIRIDMFDSKNGPVLGEFTPFPSKGKTLQLEGCIRTRLFIEHAKHGGVNDDLVLLGSFQQRITSLLKNSTMLTPLEQSNFLEVLALIPDNLNDLTVAKERSTMFQKEAIKWKSYTPLEKCEKVMEAQSLMLLGE